MAEWVAPLPVTPLELGIVLVEPRIPQNVGNIGRLCACTGAKLILIGDLGFQFSEKQLQRAGMDYLEHITPERFPDFTDLRHAYPDWGYTLVETGTARPYWERAYPARHFLIFGSETHGLPQGFLAAHAEHHVSVPMLPDRRSLNVANTAAIVLYEAIRQQLNLL